MNLLFPAVGYGRGLVDWFLLIQTVNQCSFQLHSSSLSSKVPSTSGLQASEAHLSKPASHYHFSYCTGRFLLPPHNATPLTACLSTLWLPRSGSHFSASVIFSPIFLCSCRCLAFTKIYSLSFGCNVRGDIDNYAFQFPIFKTPGFYWKYKYLSMNLKKLAGLSSEW